MAFVPFYLLSHCFSDHLGDTVSKIRHEVKRCILGFVENLAKKRISSIIKSKSGKNVEILECVPVIIRNSGMSSITKHEGDGWFALTSGGAYFVDNYIAINLEPVKEIIDTGAVVNFVLSDDSIIAIQPKHETARKVVLSTKISKG